MLFEYITKDLVYRVIRYCIVGTVAALVFFALVVGMVEWLGISVMIATATAYVIVTLQNYVLHYVWTFQSTELHRTSLPKFITSNIAGFFLNWGIMYAGTEQLQLNYLLVQGAAVVAIIAWNLIVGSLWIFKNPIEAEGKA